MKKIKYIVMLLLCFFINIGVNAEDVYESEVCKNLKTGAVVPGCYVVCQYSYIAKDISVTYEEWHSNYASTKTLDIGDKQVLIEIGYYPDSLLFQIRGNDSKTGDYYESSLAGLSALLNSSSVINYSSLNITDFKCPAKAYMSNIDGNDVVCLDEGDSSCFDNYSNNIYINFGTESNISGTYMRKPTTNGFNFGVYPVGTTDCGILGVTSDPYSTAYYLQLMFDVLKYLGICALIVLTIADYFKAVTSSDTDAVSRANKTAVKRLVYTILLFLFPVLLEMLFTLVGIYGSSSESLCSIG